MSTTTSPYLGVPAEKAFDELAFNEPTVCSRCFSLIRTRDTFRPDVLSGVSQYAPEERLRRAFDGTHGYRTEDMDEYGVQRVHRPCTYCSECGSQSGRAEDHDLSRRNAIIFADNLIARLQESDVDVDTHALKFTVGKLKSDERLNGVDTEIFRRATKLGIKRARY